jgi:hypothetical protein
MKLLDRLSECLDSVAARNASLEQFRASGKMTSESAAGHAADTLASLWELCSSNGEHLDVCNACRRAFTVDAFDWCVL